MKTKTVREEAMTQIIVAKLRSDSRTSNQTIDVIVEEDKIFLVGVVDSENIKDIAISIVQGSCGVHSVVDKLTVRRLRQML